MYISCDDSIILIIVNHLIQNLNMQSYYKYDSFWILLIIGCLVPLVAVSISNVIAYSRKSPEKGITYESGIEPLGESWIQFQIRYYMFALVFVVFDVETVFLYPWAISFDQLGVTSFVEVVIFLLILTIGLIYSWRIGALEWS
jgi:NAD(P)H-quinone oxidoreductase subunit 3